MAHPETRTRSSRPSLLTSCLIALLVSCLIAFYALSGGLYGSPLHKACAQGDLKEVVRLLQDPATDPNLPDKYGRSPLGYACGGGHLDVVKCLLANERVDPNTPDILGWTPLDSIQTMMSRAKTQAEWDRYNAIWDELLSWGGRFVKEKPASGSLPDKPARPADKG